MYCVKCGRQLQDEANFCPFCGTKAYRPEPTEKQNEYPVETLALQTAAPAPAPALEAEAPGETRESLWALISGILALCLFWTIVPGIALGLVSMVYGVRSTTKYPDIAKGQAVAGFILGITAIALSVFMIAQLFGSSDVFSGLSQTKMNLL